MPATRGGDSLDWDPARAFIASIPRGGWAAYGDVAAAAGAASGAQALGRWLATNEIEVPPLLYRVIRSDGTVSPGYVSVDWPGLPDDPGSVEKNSAAREFASMTAGGQTSRNAGRRTTGVERAALGRSSPRGRRWSLWPCIGLH